MARHLGMALVLATLFVSTAFAQESALVLQEGEYVAVDDPILLECLADGMTIEITYRIAATPDPDVV
ncbi:MAG: hypothetical protein O3A46_15065, partial [Candidatus Poribacteria bacterium]|nr:hypothetical protein [Candidatus Poribacteria bacterium]